MTVTQSIMFFLGLVLIGFILYLIAISFKADEEEARLNTWVDPETGEYFFVNKVEDLVLNSGEIRSKVYYTSKDSLQQYTMWYTDFLLIYQTVEEYERSKEKRLRS